MYAFQPNSDGNRQAGGGPGGRAVYSSQVANSGLVSPVDEALDVETYPDSKGQENSSSDEHQLDPSTGQTTVNRSEVT